MSNTQKETKRYLGGVAMSSEIYATLDYQAKSDQELNALYLFWRDSCNYGLEPFLMSIPFFGINLVQDSVLVKFRGDFVTAKNNDTWGNQLEIQILGTVIYIIDDNQDMILDDAGDFIWHDGDLIATGNQINTYREVQYG